MKEKSGHFGKRRTFYSGGYEGEDIPSAEVKKMTERVSARLRVEELAVTPLLDLIDAQAADADQSRRISANVIAALKANPVMGLSAAEELGGGAASVVRCGEELEAVTARCASTGWVLMNHLGALHLFAGLLGPDKASLLREVVTNNEWVCFPSGSGTAVRGTFDGSICRLQGQAAFGSGARYANWAGVVFQPEGEDRPRFVLLDIHQEAVDISDDWYAMSLRASATDSLYYRGAEASVHSVVPFPRMYREVFRRPDHPMIAHRYREDWVALSNMWMGYMAVGLLQACLDEVTVGIRDSVALMGGKVAERPNVHMNLGHAQANIHAARDTVQAACVETDARIASEITPTESDYFRQLGAAMTALKLCDEALRLMVRVMGGNGLREGPAFERRWRDFQAMPVHINTHEDRVSEHIGRHMLGLAPKSPF